MENGIGGLESREWTGWRGLSGLEVEADPEGKRTRGGRKVAYRPASSWSRGGLVWHAYIDSIIPCNVILCIRVIATNRLERHTEINDLKVTMAEWASMNSREQGFVLHCKINNAQNNVLTSPGDPSKPVRIDRHAN